MSLPLAKEFLKSQDSDATQSMWKWGKYIVELRNKRLRERGNYLSMEFPTLVCGNNSGYFKFWEKFGFWKKPNPKFQSLVYTLIHRDGVYTAYYSLKLIGCKLK